ncbi:MAG: hypothetical protein AB9866_08150 [Syntrophobacteraceae bacterium]
MSLLHFILVVLVMAPGTVALTMQVPAQLPGGESLYFQGGIWAKELAGDPARICPEKPGRTIAENAKAVTLGVYDQRIQRFSPVQERGPATPSGRAFSRVGFSPGRSPFPALVLAAIGGLVAIVVVRAVKRRRRKKESEPSPTGPITPPLQKCPVCKGTGVVMPPWTGGPARCLRCKGTGRV